MNDARAVYIRDLIMSRCGDVLTVEEIAEAFTPSDDERLPVGITDQVLNLISMMSDRLDAMESRLTPGRLN